MNSSQYRDFLLQSIPGSKPASGGRVVNCRCLFCPDSKNPNSKHMYISIPHSNDEPSLYNCYKCHSSGVVTYKSLIEWDIYDDEIGENMLIYSSYLFSSRRYFFLYFNSCTYEQKALYKLCFCVVFFKCGK